MYLRHTASNNILLYQPMNWLATHIPSLRDFTQRDSALTRPTGSYTAAPPPLHAAKQPYTARQRPYTPDRALHVPKAPSTAAMPPFHAAKRKKMLIIWRGARISLSL